MVVQQASMHICVPIDSKKSGCWVLLDIDSGGVSVYSSPNEEDTKVVVVVVVLRRRVKKKTPSVRVDTSIQIHTVSLGHVPSQREHCVSRRPIERLPLVPTVAEPFPSMGL